MKYIPIQLQETIVGTSMKRHAMIMDMVDGRLQPADLNASQGMVAFDTQAEVDEAIKTTIAWHQAQHPDFVPPSFATIPFSDVQEDATT